MKYELSLIALSLFWYFPVYLDLDTGKTYNTKLYTQEEIDQIKNKVRIPNYCDAIIFQRYLEMAQKKGAVDARGFLDKYPRFEMIPEYTPENVMEFYKEAEDLCVQIIDDTIPDFPTFDTEFRLQAAKEWCKEQGYEWY